MVKVLTGVQPGQASEVEQKVIAGSPVEKLQERTPQPSILSGIVAEAAQSAPVEDIAAGVQAGAEAELAIQGQQEREAVPDIATRAATDAPVGWDFDSRQAAAKAANNGDQGDGGLEARANFMAGIFTEGERGIGGLTAAADNTVKQTLGTTGAIDAAGNWDPDFLRVTSLITENTLASLAFSRDTEGNIIEEGVDPAQVVGRAFITKSQGNTQLGKQIHRDYQRYRNAKEGKPTDQYNDISDDEATLLGDVAKEMYYEANNALPEGEKVLARGRAPDGQATFALTKHGNDMMRLGETDRKRMFPKNNIRPSKIPLPGGKLAGEGQKLTKRVSGKVGTPANADVINEAMRNLNQVANVVDPQRLKILLATVLPVLRGDVGPDHTFATINHIGMKQLNKLISNPNVDENVEYAKQVQKLADYIQAIAKERKGANHLTYYMQSFNGRIAPQQTNFDPTTSKSVRFVTRNAVPANTANPRIEKNLRQMYAMMLVKGADALLPEGREKALEQATPQLIRWGKELRAALDVISDADIEAAADAIANGVPLNDPSFPLIPDVSKGISPELAAAIESKGEDGQAFIDGVLDFTDYYQKKVNGKPHHSYFNAYMDGKTNGLASNGIQMGSERVAYKTGVLRSQEHTLLDGNEDIRDDLRNITLASLDDGFDGAVAPELSGPLHRVAAKIFSIRDFNKATTMTFGYGKELESFKKDMKTYLDEAALTDPELQADMEALGSVDYLAPIHAKYVAGLEQVLDKNALESRGLMRGAAYLFALSNEIFTIDSATGMELLIGGTARTPWTEKTKYKVWTGSKYEWRKHGASGAEVTSAATKTRPAKDEGEVGQDEVGGHAYGGSVPAPIQSLDAATVALTASGKSWSKLKGASGGNPYLHTIYDAFKVDAMGYDVVLDEVNKNWLDAGMNWSYLEQTQAAIERLRGQFQERYKGRSAGSPLTEGEAAQMKWFLEMTESADGKLRPNNLKNKLSKLIEMPANADPDLKDQLAGQAANRVVAAMKAAGWNLNSPPPPNVGHIKAFMGAFSKEINLSSRLGRMIEKTNTNKKKLAAKIKRDGAPVYQYYAH